MLRATGHARMVSSLVSHKGESKMLMRATGHARMVCQTADVAWPAARSAALWAFCRRQNAPEGQRETTRRNVRQCMVRS